MKKIIYFKEDTQELKELPIKDENCYYLGEFTTRQIMAINKVLEKKQLSYIELSKSLFLIDLIC